MVDQVGPVFSAGTQIAPVGLLSFANSNGVSWGITGETLTASILPGPAAGIAAIAAGTQTGISATINFLNSNGVSFGLNNSSQMTASIAPGAASVQISAGTTSNNLGTIVFANSNGVTFGLNGGTITASATGGGGFPNFSAGTNSSTLDAVVFSNSNGVSFGLNGSTITASAAAGAGTLNLSAGTTSNNLQSVVFSNSNGVSFGLNGSTVTGSVAGQSVQSLGGYAVGNTTGASSSSTIDARSLSFSGAGAVSVGYQGGSVIISAAAGAQSAQTMGIYASSNTTGQSSSSTIDARSFSIEGLGAVSVGMSQGTLQISAPATVAITQLSAGISTGGNTSGNTGVVGGQLVFAGGNNITLSGSTNGSSMTVTISGGLSQSVQTLGMYAVGNSTQNSSTTLDARTVSFDGLGAMSVGYSNGSVQLSAPNTSQLVAAGLVSLSTNGSTITISASLPQQSFFQAMPFDNSSLTQIGNGAVQVYPAPYPEAFTATRADALASMSISSSSNSSFAGTISVAIGIYTRNASTLSLASSGSQSYAFTNTSNNSLGSLSGARRLSVPINVNYTGGDIFIAMNSQTASANANWFTASNVVVPWGLSSQLAGLIGEATGASKQYMPGMGIYSATSAGLPASMALSNISGAGSNGQGPDLLPPINFVNMTA